MANYPISFQNHLHCTNLYIMRKFVLIILGNKKKTNYSSSHPIGKTRARHWGRSRVDLWKGRAPWLEPMPAEGLRAYGRYAINFISNLIPGGFPKGHLFAPACNYNNNNNIRCPWTGIGEILYSVTAARGATDAITRTSAINGISRGAAGSTGW